MLMCYFFLLYETFTLLPSVQITPLKNTDIFKDFWGQVLPSVITFPTIKSSLWTNHHIYKSLNRWQISKPLAYLSFEMFPLFTAQIPFSTNIPVTNTSVELPSLFINIWLTYLHWWPPTDKSPHSQIPRSNLSSTDGL